METKLKAKLTIDKTNWTQVKFGDVVFEPKENAKDIYNEGIEHVVGLEHIDSENIHLTRSGGLEETTTFSKKFRKGDVLFGRRRAYLKKAALASFDGICSGDITVFRAKKNLLPELLPFIVSNEKFFDYAVKHSAGGLSPRVKFKDLANYEFLLPPAAQQAQLAELLWAMDEVIEKEKEVFDRLKMLMLRKREFIFVKGNGSIYQKPFSSYKIPEHWSISKMSDVAKVEYGISESVANNTDPSIGWQILTGANINLDGSFDLSKKRYIEIPTNERFLLQQGDLMFNWRSGSPEHIGKTAIYNLVGNYTYASFILRIRCGKDLSNRYAFYLLNYLREIEFFSKNIAQQVNFKINATVFREILIPVPPINEQCEIENILDLIHYQILEVESKISTSQGLQKSLINQIF
jgi:type I restriction enzyme, S subunit